MMLLPEAIAQLVGCSLLLPPALAQSSDKIPDDVWRAQGTIHWEPQLCF